MGRSTHVQVGGTHFPTTVAELLYTLTASERTEVKGLSSGRGSRVSCSSAGSKLTSAPVAFTPAMTNTCMLVALMCGITGG